MTIKSETATGYETIVTDTQLSNGHPLSIVFEYPEGRLRKYSQYCIAMIVNHICVCVWVGGGGGGVFGKARRVIVVAFTRL